jgi:hypothetical protein
MNGRSGSRRETHRIGLADHRDVGEMALAHAIGDRVEAAYRRGDLFEKRRRLMADWAAFCGRTQPSGVVSIGRKNAS